MAYLTDLGVVDLCVWHGSVFGYAFRGSGIPGFSLGNLLVLLKVGIVGISSPIRISWKLGNGRRVISLLQHSSPNKLQVFATIVSGVCVGE